MGAEAVQEYFLWLDESGDFEESRKGNGIPSLVGGVACGRAVLDNAAAAPGALLSRILGNHDFHEAIRNDPSCRDDARHSTELPKAIRTAARVVMLRECANAGFQFVIFQSHRKISIGDATTNYLNFLAEGIAQYIAHLSACTSGAVRLAVVIGRRVDTVQMAGGRLSMIGEDRCTEIIRERVELAKARCLFDGASRISYTVAFDSDKRNDYLVLSDYICSCRFTLGSRDPYIQREFGLPAADGLTRRALAEHIFRTQGVVFGLYEDRIRMELRHHLNSGNYGSALYLSMAQAEPDSISRRELLSRFQALSAGAQKVHLGIFFELVRSLIHLRSFRESAGLLEHFLAQLPELPLKREDITAFCAFNARLYLATVYNHLGRTDMAAGAMSQCEDLLPQILTRPENVDLYYILRNRQAVICQDDFCYQQALALLDEAIDIAKMQERNRQELFDMIDLPSAGSVPEECAKLLGTRAETYQYLLLRQPELYPRAVEAAQAAADAFPFPDERRRQELTRAQIEAQSGHAHEAFRHLCLALSCPEDGLIGTVSRLQDDYTWYHVIRICRYTAASQPHQRLAEALFDLFRQKYDSVFSERYPAHAAARHAAAFCAGSRRFSKDRDRFYRQCRELCFRPENPGGVLWAIGLACDAEQTARCLKDGPSSRLEGLLKNLTGHTARARGGNGAEGLTAHIADWSSKLSAAGKDPDRLLAVCEQISREVPY